MVNILKLLCEKHKLEYYYNKFNEQHTFRYYFYDDKYLEYNVNEIKLFSHDIENTRLKDLESMFETKILNKLIK